MSYDDHIPAGAAPVRARSEEIPPPASGPALSPPQDSPGAPSQPHFRAQLPEDLQVPWRWTDVAMFVILGMVATEVVTRGLAQLAISFFGANPGQMFGSSMNTTKSLVVLTSQAILDGGAILYLYLMLLVRTPEPFWRSIGWRKIPGGPGPARANALQFLTGGAVLAVAVTFAGGFLNSKETLPIEQLLQARISMVVFAVLGVMVAPLVEETIFRGFLYPVIARRVGIAAGVLITGTLFGLLHAAQLWGGWGQIVLLILVGVVLTWVRARTGTVAASYFVHLGYNGLQLVGYVIYIMGGARH